MKFHRLIIALAVILALSLSLTTNTNGQTLRIGEYNLDADTGGDTGQMGGTDAGPGLIPVLEAMGQEHLDGHAQPLDVLALEELDINGTSTPLTETFIVNQLNSYYQSIGEANIAQYAVANANTVDPTSGGTGGGPSGLIYNTKTVTDLGVKVIGTVSTSGEARAPMRYELSPIGGAAYTDFYVYVSHAKSDGSDPTTSAARRNVEAQNVRADAATLGANAHIIYTGDWNINDSTEQTYQTLIASGTGQAIDTANIANNWLGTSTFKNLMTESATKLEFRDDLQLVTSPTVTLPGLQLVTNTLTPFGNNGSVAVGGNVKNGTALSDLPNQSTILTDLTTDTDHLPTLADYVIVPPGDFNRDQQVNSSDIPQMLSALANLPAYEASHGGLTNSQVLAIGDVNGDGVFNNADVQALLMFLAAGHGTGAPAPEPATAVLLGLAVPGFAMLLRRRWCANR
jgi:hypothetical protein